MSSARMAAILSRGRWVKIEYDISPYVTEDRFIDLVLFLLTFTNRYYDMDK